MTKNSMAKRRAYRRPQKSNAVGEYAADAWSLAKRTAVGLNEIRKLINVEQKYVELGNNFTYDRAGAVVYLSGVAQGDSTITREGNSIKVQTMRFNFFIKHNASVTGGTCHRILVVRDLQNQGATITADDVLQSLGGSDAPLTHRDFVNGPLQNKRFALVYDQMLVTDPYHLIRHEEFVTNHDVHVYYRGTDDLVASAGNGSYFLIAVSSDTGSLPSLFYRTRLEFTDN